MPRLCFSIEKGWNKFYFNLKIIFNDYQTTGMSSLFEKTVYKYTLYTFKYKKGPSFNQSISMNDLFKIDAEVLVNETRPIKSTNVIEIKNLVHGKYLLEV